MLSWSWDNWVFLVLLFAEGLALLVSWLARKNQAQAKALLIVELICEVTGVLLLGFSLSTAYQCLNDLLTNYTSFLLLPIVFVLGLITGFLLGLRALILLLGKSRLFKISLFLKTNSFGGILSLILSLVALGSSFLLSVWGTSMGSWSWYTWGLLIILLYCSFMAIVEFIGKKNASFQKITNAINWGQGFGGLVLVGLALYSLFTDFNLLKDSIPYFPLTMVFMLAASLVGVCLGLFCMLDLLRLFKLLKTDGHNLLLKIIRFPKLFLGINGSLLSLYLVAWIFEKWSF